MTRSAALLLLFFGSGAAALAYEVVWIRLLSLTLSVTVYALTTVLCAFMAGLALGAAIAARIADRLPRPALAFGLAELGIAASGLLTLWLLPRLGPAYVALHQSFGESSGVFLLLRFLLAFAVLLVPTTLMGMTLPFLSRVVVQERGAVARGVGALYAANTLGAVSGCIAAGFLLVPQWGLSATSLVAASLNVAIAAVACVWSFETPAAPAAREGDAAPSRMPLSSLLAAATFGVSGFTAMGYEVLWTRALEHFTHNSTYAYSAMLATFLAGIGFGSACAARPADRSPNPLALLGGIQLVIAATVIGALCLYLRFDGLIGSWAGAMGGITSWAHAMGLVFIEAGLTLFATTFLFGATFPVVARTVVDSLDSLGRRIGFAYLCNTLGSILGAAGIGFFVLPALGVGRSFLALILLNAFVGGGLLIFALEGRRRAAGLVGALATGALAVAWVPGDLLLGQYLDRYGKILFYREEVTDTVMVTESPSGERTIRYGDGRGTAGTWTVVEDRMYAHIPMLLHGAPRSVLQIGFGVGNTLRSVGRYPIDRAICVELSPGVSDAAPFFRSTNHDVLDDPRISLVVNDGRNFLLATQERFDVIRLDPPELHTAGVVNLYTREFYELARDHLGPQGIFSIWVNTVMTPTEDLRLLLRTVADVFPHTSVWHGPAGYSWVINGSAEPHDPDLVRLGEAFRRGEVATDLASIGIEDAFDFLEHFVFTGQALARFAGDGPLVVDDHTRLDFTVPRSADSFFGLGNVNTDYSLVGLTDPDGSGDHQVAARLFLRKVAEMQALKRPVLPHLKGIQEAGFEAAEVAERLGGRSSGLQRSSPSS